MLPVVMLCAGHLPVRLPRIPGHLESGSGASAAPQKSLRGSWRYRGGRRCRRGRGCQLIKDPAHEALAQPARRRVRGIAAQSIFTALLLMAASIRKTRAWRALTPRDKARITRRARRRRTSLRDYLPDG